IITNAGGCGSHLKHYRKLLADDPAYRDRAQEWDRKVKDIHEWLIEIGIEGPTDPRSSRREEVQTSKTESRSRKPEIDHNLLTSAATESLIVTYHESC